MKKKKLVLSDQQMFELSRALIVGGQAMLMTQMMLRSIEKGEEKANEKFKKLQEENL